jgi:predicted nucleic acid-binding protein
MRVVLDTSALIAIHEPKDQYHTIAKNILKDLLNAGIRFIIPNTVYIEFSDNLVSHYGKKSALEKLSLLKKSKFITFLNEEKEDFTLGEGFFQKFNDVDTSLTDSIIFSFMKWRKFRRIFTFDSHFQMMDFVVIPELNLYV